MSGARGSAAAHRLATLARRVRNIAVRWRHGLRIRAESVSPLEANDLYVAHLSIYDFGGQFAAGSRVLDLGCGTGYGSAHLLEAGATEVVGVDLDDKAIRFASKRFGRSGLTYRRADAQDLPDDLGTFGFVLSSNVIEHIERVDDALAGVAARLHPDGRFLMVVPPITDEETLAVNERNPFHLSNFHVDEWRTHLSAHFQRVRCFQQVSASGKRLDALSPFPSELTTDDFGFNEVTGSELAQVPTMSAVFLCETPAVQA